MWRLYFEPDPDDGQMGHLLALNWARKKIDCFFLFYIMGRSVNAPRPFDKLSSIGFLRQAQDRQGTASGSATKGIRPKTAAQRLSASRKGAVNLAQEP